MTQEQQRLTLEEITKLPTGERMKHYWKRQGPAWTAIALNIGGATATNSIMVSAVSGLKFMWVVIPQVFAIWMLCYMFTKMVLFSGQSPLPLVKRELGMAVAWILGGSIFLVNLVFNGIQFALIGNIMNSMVGGDPRLWGILGVVFAVAVVFMPARSGSTALRAITFFLKIAVMFLILSFGLVLFFIDIDFAAIIDGFTLQIPETPQEIAVVAGLLGAAMAINVPFLAAAHAYDEKFGRHHLGLSLFELTITNFLLLLVQYIIMVVTTATLFKAGIMPRNAVEASLSLTPLAGSGATILFSLGLLGAVFTTIVSQVLVCGYVIAGMMGWNTQDAKFKTTLKFRGSQLLVLIFGASVPIFGWNAFSVSIYGGAFNLTFMPVALIIAWIILNRKKVMGEGNTLSGIANVLAFITLVMTLIGPYRFWASIFGF
jgi:Mn2+/Fe2+ NRAMP family transporter